MALWGHRNNGRSLDVGRCGVWGSHGCAHFDEDSEQWETNPIRIFLFEFPNIEEEVGMEVGVAVGMEVEVEAGGNSSTSSSSSSGAGNGRAGSHGAVPAELPAAEGKFLAVPVLVTHAQGTDRRPSSRLNEYGGLVLDRCR